MIDLVLLPSFLLNRPRAVRSHKKHRKPAHLFAVAVPLIGSPQAKNSVDRLLRLLRPILMLKKETELIVYDSGVNDDGSSTTIR